MENSRSVTDWNKISFPVFKLIVDNPPKTINGITFLWDEYLNMESELLETKYRIIDDKNVPGDTLGARRLRLKFQKAPLAKLGSACYFIGDIIKVSTPINYFVDNNGLVFRYDKTRFVSLIFRKIIKKLPIAGGTGSIIEVEGISSRFKTLFSLKPWETVAGLIKIGNSYILYGIYDTMYNDTKRKV